MHVIAATASILFVRSRCCSWRCWRRSRPTYSMRQQHAAAIQPASSAHCACRRGGASLLRHVRMPHASLYDAHRMLVCLVRSFCFRNNRPLFRAARLAERFDPRNRSRPQQGALVRSPCRVVIARLIEECSYSQAHRGHAALPCRKDRHCLALCVVGCRPQWCPLCVLRGKAAPPQAVCGGPQFEQSDGIRLGRRQDARYRCEGHGRATAHNEWRAGVNCA